MYAHKNDKIYFLSSHEYMLEDLSSPNLFMTPLQRVSGSFIIIITLSHFKEGDRPRLAITIACVTNRATLSSLI